jgi:hypothetical protein
VASFYKAMAVCRDLRFADFINALSVVFQVAFSIAQLTAKK